MFQNGNYSQPGLSVGLQPIGHPQPQGFSSRPLLLCRQLTKPFFKHAYNMLSNTYRCVPALQADYYPEYLYVSVILLSVDHPSSLGRQDSANGAAAVAAGSGSARAQHVQQRRTSDRGGAAGAVGGGGPPFGGDMSKALRTRLFGAAGANKVQADKDAAAAGSAAALLQMQPMVEQASMFLFRCAGTCVGTIIVCGTACSPALLLQHSTTVNCSLGASAPRSGCFRPTSIMPLLSLFVHKTSLLLPGGVASLRQHGHNVFYRLQFNQQALLAGSRPLAVQVFLEESLQTHVVGVLLQGWHPYHHVPVCGQRQDCTHPAEQVGGEGEGPRQQIVCTDLGSLPRCCRLPWQLAQQHTVQAATSSTLSQCWVRPPASCRLLQGFRSLLTDSQDASYLFNAVLDAVVDHTLPLVQVNGRAASSSAVSAFFCSSGAVAMRCAL